jgi:hypothetical protein
MIFLLSVHGTFNIFPDMLMSFFHSVLEYTYDVVRIVNEHQNDWDEHLLYVSMAYRAAGHETTGNTPNYMVLGREVTTPLDIQYCMPRSIVLSVHGTFNIFPDMFMSFFHSVLEYPCPTILRDMCNAT